MRRLTAAFVFLSVFAADLSSQQSAVAPPPGLDRYVESVMRAFEVPGVSLAIVKDGRTVVARGYGVRALGESAPVDAHTLFGIASNTKAFTATALGMLVEERKVAWDAPVVDYLPWFRMADPYVTAQLTVRDLLVHRSGLSLGAGDLLWWPPSEFSRREIAERLRHVPLTTSFRNAYAYDNVLYVVAGELIEHASGMSWEQFIEQRILDRIGMPAATPHYAAGAATGNIATPHARVDGRVRAVAPFTADNSNAAAGIMAGALDMARWLTVQLDSGRISQTERIFAPATARQLWTIVTPINIGEPARELAPQRMSFNGYGLGFNVRDYRGQKLVMHSGGLPGYLSRVMMLPDLKLGVAVLTNQESGAAFDAIAYHILDHYLADVARTRFAAHDWLAAYRAVAARADSSVAAADARAAAERDSLSRPSLAPAAYAGTYRDPWYGDVILSNDAGRLRIRFSRTPSLVGELVHWQHDTFVARWDDRELRADAFVTFVLNPDATIAEMRMVPASPSVDFSFDFQDLRLRRLR